MKLLITGAVDETGVTVTVVDCMAFVAPLVAVRVYVVLVVGETVVLVPVTVPTPGVIERLVALLTDQFNVALLPAVMVEGVAAKLAITGVVTAAGETVTVVVY